MWKNLWFWLTALLTIAALVASALLLVDYIKPAPVFCEATGCARVKLTAFARPLGVPMPAIGIAGMLGVGLAALVPGRPARIVQAALAGAGALVALVLLGVQGAMGVLCPFCAVVDGAALVLAGLAVARLRKGWDPPPGRAIPSAVAVGFVAATAIPFGVGIGRRVIPHDVPPQIAEEIKKSGKKVTVVDFVDFECPYCRMTHAELAPLLEKQKGNVRVVRKHVPLRVHPHALDAAKAGCCGETLGKGDAMADALFKAPPEELTPEGCEKLAKDVGIDLDAFRACVRDPATMKRIDQDKEAFRAVKGHGLPTIWIDATRLDGSQDRATLEQTLGTAVRAL